MPAAKPPEFRQRAVELARQRDKSIREIAHDLGTAESGSRRWMRQDDIDSGREQGLACDERAELLRLHREYRVQAVDIGILKRASVHFPRENVLPRPVHELADDYDVAVICRIFIVCRSGLLPVAHGPAVRPGPRRRAARGHDPRDLRRLAGRLQGAAGARRTAPRPAGQMRLETGGPVNENR